MNSNEPQQVVETKVRRKLSLFRVFIALLILFSIMYSAEFGFEWWKTQKILAQHVHWFAAYVDVTATPTYPFEEVGTQEAKNVVLSFIVASNEDSCKPTWGTHYDMDEASVALDLDRRIARLKQQEGAIAISFGGALNSELAEVCEDEEQLLKAYESVIKRYQVSTIDLDLENTGLTNLDAGIRRAKVIAQLQKKRMAENKNLAVWVTLPVAPQGLTQDGTNAVITLLNNGVDLAGVNIMTMDYGESKPEDQTMFEASKDALNNTHRQLGILYKQAGINLSFNTLWRKIGVTPMIGQNDVLEEVFSIKDAELLNEYAVQKDVGRISMWSANRDAPCGSNYIDLQVVSDSCSGVDTEKMEFARVLSQNFTGSIVENEGLITVSEHIDQEEIVDDPEKSPYQIWDEKGAYLKGTKVVWRKNVYEAKWWTKGDLPDDPVLQSWETPWKLLGPVLPNEKFIEQPTLPIGTYPEWRGEDTYQAGDRVLFEGTPFQSKWWNKGDSPAASSSNPDGSAWVPLSLEEVEELL